MVEVIPSLPGLSPVSGKALIARFDGGDMSSDGGLLALREIEARLGVAGRLAACLRDLRAPERIRHSVAEMLRFRLLMIAAAYEDGNDADSLRHDPSFKLANLRLPVRRQHLWDQTGDLSYAGFLAHRNPKESEDEPAAITLGGLEAFPHTLSTSLTVRAVNGKLSRLALASSPGAFTAPQMARRLRSVSQPSDQPQMI